jgi:hypothetical protein
VAALLEGAGLRAWTARKFFVLSGGTRREPVMGLHGPADRIATLQRAQELVGQPALKTRAFYVEIEIHNLGGLNEQAGSASAANEHLAAYARVVGHALDGLDAHAVMFRQGGPRFSAVVYADETVDQGAVQDAMQQAQATIESYVRSEGLSAATYPKDPDDPGAGGAGIHFGVARIHATALGARQEQEGVRDILRQAEKALLANAAAQSTRRREEAQARGAGQASDPSNPAMLARLLNEGPSRAMGGGRGRSRVETRIHNSLINNRAVEVDTTGAEGGRFPGQIEVRKQVVLAYAGQSRAAAPNPAESASNPSDTRGVRGILEVAFLMGGGQNRDRPTGLEAGDNRVPTLERATAHVRRNPTDHAFYVVVDIANVGGMNAQHSKSKVNREVLHAFATILRDRLRNIGKRSQLSVSGFRHGGDELSFVLVGTGLSETAVHTAMVEAQAQVRQAATVAGLMTTPPLKKGRPPGTGIYFHIAPILGDSHLPTLLDAADRALEGVKHAAHGPQASEVRARPMLPPGWRRGAAGWSREVVLG